MTVHSYVHNMSRTFGMVRLNSFKNCLFQKKFWKRVCSWNGFIYFKNSFIRCVFNSPGWSASPYPTEVTNTSMNRRIWRFCKFKLDCVLCFQYHSHINFILKMMVWISHISSKKLYIYLILTLNHDFYVAVKK